MSKRELHLGTEGSILVLTELADRQFTLPGDVKDIIALGPTGVIPSLMKGQMVTVTFKNESRPATVGKYIGRDAQYVIIETDGKRMTFSDCFMIECPLENSWEVDEHKDVCVRAQLHGIFWNPQYTMIVQDKKIKQLTLRASITNTGSVIDVDKITFKTSESGPAKTLSYIPQSKSLQPQSEQIVRKTVKVEKGQNGLMTYIWDHKTRVEPIRSIPLWNMGDFQEEQVYFLSPNASKIQYGYRLSVKKDFFPPGLMEVYNEEHVLLCNIHISGGKNDQTDLIIGDSPDITLESIPSTWVKKTSYKITSKLVKDATLLIKKDKEESAFVLTPGVNELSF